MKLNQPLSILQGRQTQTQPTDKVTGNNLNIRLSSGKVCNSHLHLIFNQRAILSQRDAKSFNADKNMLGLTMNYG